MVPAPSQKPTGNVSAPLNPPAFEPLAHESESNCAPEDVGVWIHRVNKNALEEREQPSRVVVGG